MDKKLQLLKKERNLKDREIRKLKRTVTVTDAAEEKRAKSLEKGAVWLIPDKSVPFDAKRELKDIKPFGRPCLCLHTPVKFHSEDLVTMAPGTSKPHRFGPRAADPVLFAKVPPERLHENTYFLLYFWWNARQKTLISPCTKLSKSLLSIASKLQRQYGI